MEILEYLDCHSICLLDKAEVLQNKFIDISDLGDMVEAYKNEYFSLKIKSEK